MFDQLFTKRVGVGRGKNVASPPRGDHNQAAGLGAGAPPDLQCPIRAAAPPEMRARPKGRHRGALAGSTSENSLDFVVAEPKQVRPVAQLESRRPERVTE